jgi:hypothetical protein
MRLLFGVALIVIVLTLSQCTVKKPQSPTWDTRLIVPLVNRTYPMTELIDKLGQDEIGFDADSNVIFSMSRDLDTFRIAQGDLTIGSMAYSLSQQLGNIDINTPAPATMNAPLSTIQPLALGGNIPPTSFTLYNDPSPSGVMTSATVAGGSLKVTIGNNLGLDLDSVTVTLHDLLNGVPLGSYAFPGGVPTGSSDSIDIDLSGATLSNQLRCILECDTPGGTLLVTGNQDITSTMSFSSPFTVSAATAQVPALSRSFSENISLNKSTAVYDATLQSGQLTLQISNNTPLSSTLNITLPDLYQNSTPLVISQTVNPYGSTSVNLNLAGMNLHPSDSSYPQSIPMNIVASSPGSGGSTVQINSSQNFSVSASLSGISVSSVTGVVAPTDVVISPVDQSIEVPQGFDSVQLAHATLSLEITNAVDLPGTLTLQLSGNNGKTLNLNGTIARGTGANPVVNTIVDSTVADFLWPLPSQLSVSGTATYGDGIAAGTLTNNDFVYARVSINAPFELIVHQSTVRPDISSEDMDTAAMNDIADHVTSARLVYTLNNHLPLGANFSLMLNGDSATAYSNPQVTINNLFVTAAPVNGSGLVTSAVSTGEQLVELDSVDIQVLRNPRLWIASQITLDSTGAVPVKLTAQDYITITARAEIEYRFDGTF